MPEVTTNPEVQNADHTARYDVEAIRGFGLEQTANFLGYEGYLGDSYINHMREKLSSFISSLDREVIESLRNSGGVVGLAINMGLGHIRVMIPIFKLCQILGIPTTRIVIGDKNRENVDRHIHPFVSSIVKAALQAYEEESLKLAYDQGMTTVLIEPRTEDLSRRAFERVIALIHGKRSLSEEERHRFIMGMFSAVEDNSSMQELVGGGLFGFFLRRIFDHVHAKNIVFTHPIFSVIASSKAGKLFLREAYNIISVATDAIVASTWLKDFRLLVETEEAKEKLIKDCGDRANNQVIVAEGLVSPLSSLLSENLYTERRKLVQQGEPLTCLLTASGVAPVQEASFKEFLTENAERIASGEIRVVIQSGYGYMGSLLYEKLSIHISKLGLQGEVLMHWHETAIGAVEFAEAVTLEEIPLVLVTKGGEMTRVAVTLPVPQIVTGAISEHEIHNISTSMNQNAPIFVLPHIAEGILQEAMKIWGNQEIDGLQELLNAFAIDSYETALLNAREFYLSGQMPQVNRAAVWMVLEELVRNQRDQA